MKIFLAGLGSNTQKKTAGVPAVFEESGRFIWVRSELSTAKGA
jgi:hypothetical protein